MSLRVRLFLAFFIVILITISSVALFVRQNVEQEVKAYVLRGGKIAPSELISDLENYYSQNQNWNGAADILAVHNMMGGPMMGTGRGRGSGNRASESVRLADATGKIIIGTHNNDQENVASSNDLESNSYPLRVNGEIVGYLLPQQGEPFPENFGESALLESLNRGLLTAALISAAVALALAIGLAYAVSRPVQQLTKAVSQLSQGDLNQRVVVHGNDDISQLGLAFNQMAESLDLAIENRRAMTADIAHELRTPLAIQRAHLEALQDGIYPLSMESLEPVIEQNYMLAHLVEDLRTLALADAGELRMQFRTTDLNDLVQRLATRFQSRAETFQVSIALELPEETVRIQADPDRINQILNNLVSNALRYTPGHGKITIHLWANSSNAYITVCDSGPGIPEDHLPHIFERFYRVDKSRSRSEGGTGLGLAIARQLAQIHNGSLDAANLPDGGAEFKLTLPK